MADDINPGNVTRSVPCSPVTTNVHVEPFLNDILLPLVQERTTEGTLTPVQEGQLMPNTEALTLLTGFATGEWRENNENIYPLFQRVLRLFGNPQREGKMLTAGPIIQKKPQ